MYMTASDAPRRVLPSPFLFPLTIPSQTPERKARLQPSAQRLAWLLLPTFAAALPFIIFFYSRFHSNLFENNATRATYNDWPSGNLDDFAFPRFFPISFDLYFKHLAYQHCF